MKKAATIFVVGAAAAFGIAACGSSSNNSTTAASNTTSTAATGGGAGAGQTIDIAASPSSIAYTTTSLKAKAGPATINFDNPSSALGHDVVLQDPSGAQVGKTAIITSSKASFTATLKPGTYTFFCSVPGHSATMHGTLTVK